MINFELWVWGSAFETTFNQRKILTSWSKEPSSESVVIEQEYFLSRLGFGAVKQVFEGNSSHYDVLKDGEWKRVCFMLREN